MSKYSTIIVETAVIDVRKLMTKMSKESALKIVKEHYSLTEDEEDKIDDILDDSEPKDTSNLDSSEEPVDNESGDYVIYFETEDDLDDAVGRLMFNRVIWKEQGEIDGRFKISFQDDKSLRRALKVLRKSQYVQDDFVPVAAIYFDNYDEFQKVANYIRKNDMYIEDTSFDGSVSETESLENVYLAVPTKNKDISTSTLAVRKTW